MKRKKKHLNFLIVYSTAMLLCWASGFGNMSVALSQSAGPTGPQSGEKESLPVISPRADKLLRAMGDYLKTAKQFSFNAEINFDDLLPSGQKIQYSASSDVAVVRPDRIYADYKGDRVSKSSWYDFENKRFWYDGKNMTLMDVGLGVYATKPVPDNIDATMDFLMEKYGFTPPLADFVYQDPYDTLIENVEFGIYVGLNSVEGIRCHHLAFVQQYIDWQIWIEDGKQMVPRKLVITYKTEQESPQYIAVFSEWDLEARLPDALFNFDLTSTANLEKIEFLDITENLPGKSRAGD